MKGREREEPGRSTVVISCADSWFHEEPHLPGWKSTEMNLKPGYQSSGHTVARFTLSVNTGTHAKMHTNTCLTVCMFSSYTQGCPTDNKSIHPFFFHMFMIMERHMERDSNICTRFAPVIIDYLPFVCRALYAQHKRYSATRVYFSQVRCVSLSPNLD